MRHSGSLYKTLLCPAVAYREQLGRTGLSGLVCTVWSWGLTVCIVCVTTPSRAPRACTARALLLVSLFVSCLFVFNVLEAGAQSYSACLVRARPLSLPAPDQDETIKEKGLGDGSVGEDTCHKPGDLSLISGTDRVERTYSTKFF